jgi:RNA polymerase sigma-70 factor (ECF subfamily)
VDKGQGAGNLVERACQGDQEAWAALYTSVYARLVAFAHRRLGNAELARDAVSETMARAVTKIDTYVGADEGFAPWLFGICRHVVVDIQRQTYRPLPPGLLRSDVEEPGPAEIVLDSEEQAQVRAAFARLDPDERELLELRVVGGLSSAEVAAALGKQPGTVRMAQMRALGRLRAFLEEASRVG